MHDERSIADAEWLTQHIAFTGETSHAKESRNQPLARRREHGISIPGQTTRSEEIRGQSLTGCCCHRIRISGSPGTQEGRNLPLASGISNTAEPDLGNRFLVQTEDQPNSEKRDKGRNQCNPGSRRRTWLGVG
jgi:hypothetical protein